MTTFATPTRCSRAQSRASLFEYVAIVSVLGLEEIGRGIASPGSRALVSTSSAMTMSCSPLPTDLNIGSAAVAERVVAGARHRSVKAHGLVAELDAGVASRRSCRRVLSSTSSRTSHTMRSARSTTDTSISRCCGIGRADGDHDGAGEPVAVQDRDLAMRTGSGDDHVASGDGVAAACRPRERRTPSSSDHRSRRIRIAGSASGCRRPRRLSSRIAAEARCASAASSRFPALRVVAVAAGRGGRVRLRTWPRYEGR